MAIPKWKTLLTEMEGITQANGEAAWRVAGIIKTLLKDNDFLDEACNGIVDDRDSKLSAFSGRFALSVNEMLQMVEVFPRKSDWMSGRLDILRDKTVRQLFDAKRIAASKQRQSEIGAHAVVIDTEAPRPSTRTAYPNQRPLPAPQPAPTGDECSECVALKRENAELRQRAGVLETECKRLREQVSRLLASRRHERDAVGA